MKKIIALMIAFAVLSVLPGFAQEMPPHQMEGSQQGGMGGGPGKGRMGMAQQDQIIATSDGGIVIKSGPRLMKYDSSLILVNEVEIPRPKKRENKEPGEAKSLEEITAATAASVQ